ncbi:MAG: extracellular solute-binding protein [Phycisphaerae bacterium]|nr:extracellular solute-binding protein [Phycisphaerae bacterium]
MRLHRLLILLAFVAILVVPWFARRAVQQAHADGVGGGGGGSGGAPADVPAERTLVVVTPHVEQIRAEFGHAFAAWHQRRFGQPARIDFRTPGGTTEIRRLLETQVRSVISRGPAAYDLIPASPLKASARDEEPLPELIIKPGGVEADVFFGGGSFEHAQVKHGFVATVRIDGVEQRVRARITAPPRDQPFSQSQLDETFGENAVGIERLYDPDQYWFGSALSGFGIVYNRDLLSRLGLPEPRGFADLGDPRYAGLVAMADPRQSGSVATLYDAILNKEGWDGGWKILREMCANARYFAASSTTPPTDVSQGEAAAGVSIDFYGRGQAQAILRPGEDPASSRVGYIDPPGATYIDADPVSIINGARNPQLARRFVEFCLSDEAQALWQFAPRTLAASAKNPKNQDGQPMGPARERLRRMPVKRSFYARYLDHFTDRTNPFEIVSTFPRRGWRDALGPLMGAMGIDTGDDLREAWIALNAARGNTVFPSDRLAEMERLFYAMPPHTLTPKDGAPRTVTLGPETFAEVSKDTARWRDPVKGARARVAYAGFFTANYRRVVELSRLRE